MSYPEGDLFSKTHLIQKHLEKVVSMTPPGLPLLVCFCYVCTQRKAVYVSAHVSQGRVQSETDYIQMHGHTHTLIYSYIAHNPSDKGLRESVKSLGSSQNRLFLQILTIIMCLLVPNLPQRQPLVESLADMQSHLHPQLAHLTGKPLAEYTHTG